MLLPSRDLIPRSRAKGESSRGIVFAGDPAPPANRNNNVLERAADDYLSLLRAMLATAKRPFLPKLVDRPPMEFGSELAKLMKESRGTRLG